MKKYVVVVILAFTLILQGCASKEEDKTSTETEEETLKEDVVTSTPAVDETAEATSTPAATATTAPAKSDDVLPVTVNDTGKVLIQTVSKSRTYLYNSYIISSVNGENAVVDPTEMPRKADIDINPVAIVSTHSHPDHTDSIWTGWYKTVPTLFYKEGELDTNDFHIYSVLSSHSNDEIGTSNVIMVFEVDGLRIAHMGDIGQTTLTEDQLTALGDIDIAFMQFENSYSDMSLENEKGFKLIEQLNPKIIIPTHYSDTALQILEEKYGKVTEFENMLEISKDELPDTTMNVYRILNTHKY